MHFSCCFTGSSALSSLRVTSNPAVLINVGDRYDAGAACMNHVGLSPPCTVCWVDNMACDADTCKADCLIAKVTKQPPVDKNGSLSSCASPRPPFMIFGCLSFTSADASLATRIIAGIRSFDAPGPIAGAVAFTGSNASCVHHAFFL